MRKRQIIFAGLLLVNDHFIPIAIQLTVVEMGVRSLRYAFQLNKFAVEKSTIVTPHVCPPALVATTAGGLLNLLPKCTVPSVAEFVVPNSISG